MYNTYIVHYRKELPQEQYEQLRLELFKAILTYAEGPKIVRSKLCVTVSKLSVFISDDTRYIIDTPRVD